MRVDGQFVFNNIMLWLSPALAGFGLVYLPENEVQSHLLTGGSFMCYQTGAHPWVSPLLSKPLAEHAGIRGAD